MELLKTNVEVREVKDTAQFNQSLLFSAIQGPDENKCLKMIEVLCKLGVDIHQKDDLKQSPLFYACKAGFNKIIRVLVSNGISVNDIDVYGQNPIYYCVSVGKLETTKLI